MATDTKKIDDAVLALLYLTLHDESRAWKGFDRDALARLHGEGMIEDPAGSAESVVFTPEGLQRSKALFEKMFAAPPAEEHLMEGQTRYPNISVELSDLGDQMWPILRRVSYAMSDADVDDAEIEQYKTEVQASNDPVGVSRRWVYVRR
jgi:hypothetical protein